MRAAVDACGRAPAQHADAIFAGYLVEKAFVTVIDDGVVHPIGTT